MKLNVVIPRTQFEIEFQKFQIQTEVMTNVIDCNLKKIQFILVRGIRVHNL